MCVCICVWVRGLQTIADVYTCSEVQLLGNQATSLTATEISSMDSSEFQDCTETFGSLSDWDTDQLAALADQSKTVRRITNYFKIRNCLHWYFALCLSMLGANLVYNNCLVCNI